MGRIVMKFGGSSVATADRIKAVAEIIRDCLKRHPLVVVSAVGVSREGEVKITDQLEIIAELAHSSKPYQENLDKIRVKHEKVLRGLKLPWQGVSPIWKKLLAALKNVDRPYEEYLDEIFSFGERFSSFIIAAYLDKTGIPARCVDVDELDIITDEQFQDATVPPEDEEKVLGRLRDEDKTMVVPGFVGHTADGRITTLGRGGSDYTAALVGAAFGVEEIQIWTDVSGMRCVDPRIIPDAERLKVISFDEAKELAAFGARVLHPKTIEPAMRRNIPVVILNSFRPGDEGTTIRNERVKQNMVIKAIAHKKGVDLIDIESTRMLGASGYMARIASIFAKYGIDIEVMATSEVSISMTVNSKKNIEKAIQDLEEFSAVSLAPGKTIICVVGEGMRHTPGVSGRVFSTLGTAGVNVELISQGGSEINITFMVDDRDAERAIKALYYACIS
ncbi:MAG TPA: aspartate kinase [Candidatus Glassbacteria bacterium]|nr:aspartate kinase [Candidatus Glassbacteria bacterium]